MSENGLVTKESVVAVESIGSRRRPKRSGAMRAVIAAAALTLLGLSGAAAEVGPAFMAVPGVPGDWPADKYKGWIRVEASYWDVKSLQKTFRDGERSFFSGPFAPHDGAGRLAIAIDKRSPVLGQLMGLCAKKTRIQQVTFAESSDLMRPSSELGTRPADIPAYFEYTLGDVELSCPMAADAPEQAFVMQFNRIDWRNYAGKGTKLTPLPAKLRPAQTSGASKAFIVTWFSSAVDVSDGQCAAPNPEPGEEDYYALMSREAAAKERAALASKGGIIATAISGQLALRGPGKLNACLLPGIVRDGGHVTPQSKVARGFDLDGNDDRGDPPPGTRKHKSYDAPDGRTGIDNQLFTMVGCIEGFRRKGLLTQTSNENRRSGALSMLIDISGIDNERNDDRVEITLLYSNDVMVKNASGSKILPDYTFTVSQEPVYTQHFARLPGRIVDGVVLTESVPQLWINHSQALNLRNARMRLEILPDGSLKGVVGGYQDWRELMNFWAQYGSGFEVFMGFTCSGVYQAFKRNADGLPDPVTGEFYGISSAYDLEGVPAFIPPEQHKALADAGDCALAAPITQGHSDAEEMVVEHWRPAVRRRRRACDHRGAPAG